MRPVWQVVTELERVARHPVMIHLSSVEVIDRRGRNVSHGLIEIRDRMNNKMTVTKSRMNHNCFQQRETHLPCRANCRKSFPASSVRDYRFRAAEEIVAAGVGVVVVVVVVADGGDDCVDVGWCPL